MDGTLFGSIIELITRLSYDEKEKVILTVQNIMSNSTEGNAKLIGELREKKYSKGFSCPHCGGTHVVRYGKFKGRQRYQCKDCIKTFSDLTDTPLARTRYPDKWIRFIDCMLQGLPLRQSAKILGVTHVTLFYWRHKLLSSLRQMDISSFNGILEVDETYFLYSEKGKRGITYRKPRKRGGVAKFRGISREQVCVLVARDREKNTVSKVSCQGRISIKQVNKLIGSKVSESNILCSDAWRSYSIFARQKGLDHYSIKSTEAHVKKGIYHIQNVNNYHKRLKDWLAHFNGVASKYIDNYLAWFRFLDSKGFEKTKENLKDMLYTSCLYQMRETYRSLRLSEFSVA